MFNEEFVAQNLSLTGAILCFLIILFAIIRKNRSLKETEKKLNETFERGTTEPKTLHPKIDKKLCLGCGQCAKACFEKDVLGLFKNKATLIDPSKCLGHGVCRDACPMSAITLVLGTSTQGMKIPTLTHRFESNIEGLYVIGELSGMGLIRNAMRQGIQAAQHATKSLNQSDQTFCDYDLLIIGAGPAGLAASLVAQEKKSNYLCIEQSSFGGTINHYPKLKIINIHPTNLPLYGKMKFRKNNTTKKVLLSKWLDIKNDFKLNISENERFLQLSRIEDIFKITTSQGRYSAKKVLLAIGIGGSPKKLEVKGEGLEKVSYRLLDPGQYKKQKIVIAGAGDSAVEAAIYLANQTLENSVTLLVRKKVLSRCNSANRNSIYDLVQKGLVKIWYSSNIKEISKKTICIEKESEIVNVKNDFVFILIGSQKPFKLFNELGIKFEEKFGGQLESSL